MKLFNKVVIIGTGLIGGSLGLALKKRKIASQIIGLSRHQKNAGVAKKLGAIDCIGSSLDAVKNADLVILATPIDAIIGIALKIAEKIKKDCIVIDVGSTKVEIVSRISRVIPNFVGCHPLSGSEKKGIVNLQPDIFANYICIVTPTAKTDKKVLGKVILLWRKLGGQVVVLSPYDHDRILAFTSHLPHAIAFSLMNCVPMKFLGLSSGGLRDSTRISASDAHLWSEVFLSNRINLLASLTSFQTKLSALKLALKSKNKKTLTKILLSAKNKREILG